MRYVVWMRRVTKWNGWMEEKSAICSTVSSSVWNLRAISLLESFPFAKRKSPNFAISCGIFSLGSFIVCYSCQYVLNTIVVQEHENKDISIVIFILHRILYSSSCSCKN